jgi:hypothetical protein
MSHPDQPSPQDGKPSNWTPTPAYPIPSPPQYSAPQSPAWQPHAPAYMPLVRPTSGMATASMIFGIAGLFLFCLVVPSLIAVLCGHNALVETHGGHKAGHGQAVAGLILGYLVLVPAVFYGGFMLIGYLTS